MKTINSVLFVELLLLERKNLCYANIVEKKFHYLLNVFIVGGHSVLKIDFQKCINAEVCPKAHFGIKEKSLKKNKQNKNLKRRRKNKEVDIECLLKRKKGNIHLEKIR